MNKELIKTRFSKSLSTYNENARIQKKMAERLASFTKQAYPNILEIGCGTGFLTKILNQKLRFQNYTAIDIVQDCKTYIEEINPQIEFINEDIETFIKHNNKKYDLIISNAALQWVDNFETTIYNLQKKLNNNGELIVSTFGKENFREIGLITGKTLNYYSPKELETIFPEGNIDTEIHIIAFNTPKDVLKHLQSTGVNAIESKIWTKKDLSEFENTYMSICPNRPTLTYNPIYLKISNS